MLAIKSTERKIILIIDCSFFKQKCEIFASSPFDFADFDFHLLFFLAIFDCKVNT